MLLQCCFSKFFNINNFHLVGSQQGLNGSIKLFGKFLSIKVDVCIAKNEKRHP